MKFRMVCPKCNSASFSIERDNRSYAPKGQAFELVFSCRCGKQMFGESVIKEHDRQRKAWETNLEARAAERRAAEKERQRSEEREAALREAYAHRRRFVAERRKERRVAEELRRDEDNRRWRERVTDDGSLPPRDEEGVHSVGDGSGESCGWHLCNNPPRPNSKYCSRDCSNKNARHRYKKRKGKGPSEREAA